MREVNCPYCDELNAVTEEHEKDMAQYGKTCFCCSKCNRLFVLRDDGDGEYVSGGYPPSK